MIEFNALFPLYITENLEALKDFYTTVFGFEAVFFDAEFYLHLQHPVNNSQIGFLLPGHATQPEFLHAQAQTEGHVISFDVDSARVAFDKATEAGLDIIFTYTEEPWGQNHFMVRDPAGFVVDLVENVN